jgi:hypothetical protein
MCFPRGLCGDVISRTSLESRLLENEGDVFSTRSVRRCCKQDKSREFSEWRESLKTVQREE